VYRLRACDSPQNAVRMFFSVFVPLIDIVRYLLAWVFDSIYPERSASLISLTL
jgi:hypothetical protein